MPACLLVTRFPPERIVPCLARGDGGVEWKTVCSLHIRMTLTRHDANNNRKWARRKPSVSIHAPIIGVDSDNLAWRYSRCSFRRGTAITKPRRPIEEGATLWNSIAGLSQGVARIRRRRRTGRSSGMRDAATGEQRLGERRQTGEEKRARQLHRRQMDRLGYGPRRRPVRAGDRRGRRHRRHQRAALRRHHRHRIHGRSDDGNEDSRSQEHRRGHSHRCHHHIDGRAKRCSRRHHERRR